MPPLLHRLSSLGRALDPAYPTNRAVLFLVPAAGLAAAAASWLAGGADVMAAAGTAGRWAGGTFGCWALARELAPDDDPAAFVAMAAGAATLVAVPDAGLWLVFTGLALSRLVNRTVGPEPTVLDTLAVAGVMVASALAVGHWAPAAAGTLAFALDARLDPPGPRRHGAVAAAGAGFTLWLVATGPAAAGPAPLAGPARLVVGAGVALLLVRLLGTRQVRSRTDLGDRPLSPSRVRAGMGVAVALVAPALVGAAATLPQVALVAATLGAVGLTGLRAAWRRPATTE